MIKFQILKTLKVLLEPFNPDNNELNKFMTYINFDGYVDHFYKIKKVFSNKYRENQYTNVSKKISILRKLFSGFSGKQFVPGSNTYLVRVDDYPHWEYKNDLFEKFAGIFEDNGINILVGIVPNLSKNHHDIKNRNFRCLNEGDVKTLRKFSVIEPALHGFTHQAIRKKPYSEFLGLSVKQTTVKIEKGIEVLKQFNILPTAIISPFDTFDSRNFQAFSSFFKIVCGGYPSASSFGFWISPCVINKSIYVASYKPLSGKGEKIFKYLSTKDENSEIIPITFHWASEIENNFSYVRQIAKLIKGKSISWKNFSDLYC